MVDGEGNVVAAVVTASSGLEGVGMYSEVFVT